MGGFLHTAYRITDPESSRAFYGTLGMTVRREVPFVRNGVPETHYFLGFADQDEVLQLTFIHDGRTYELGTGYGHMAVQVASLSDALAALEKQGVQPEAPPFRVIEDSPLICFVRDPDGYPVELFDGS